MDRKFPKALVITLKFEISSDLENKILPEGLRKPSDGDIAAPSYASFHTDAPKQQTQRMVVWIPLKTVENSPLGNFCLFTLILSKLQSLR